jgi:cytochrome c2
VFCLLAAGILVGGGCSKKETGPTERTIAKSEPAAFQPHLNSDLIQGRKVFEEKHCSQCHSIFERERKIGPKLGSDRVYGSFLDIFSTLWNHAPAMAVFMRKEVLDRPQFSTSELNELISFLYMLPYLGESGNPRKGEALLRDKACFQCHSLGRQGRRDGVSLDALGVYQSQVVLLQRMWNHGPEMIGQMESTGTAIPTFSGNDMTDIFAALTESATEKRRKVFLGVGNVENGRRFPGERYVADHPDVEPLGNNAGNVCQEETVVAVFPRNGDERPDRFPLLSQLRGQTRGCREGRKNIPGQPVRRLPFQNRCGQTENRR